MNMALKALGMENLTPSTTSPQQFFTPQSTTMQDANTFKLAKKMVLF